jgi:hypothetical protein
VWGGTTKLGSLDIIHLRYWTEWLRSALFNRPNWASAFPPFHLRLVTDPVSEILHSFRILSVAKVQKLCNPECNTPSSEVFWSDLTFLNHTKIERFNYMYKLFDCHAT